VTYRSIAVCAAAALALAACGKSGQNQTGADTTTVGQQNGASPPPAPVTAPAVPPSAPTGADSEMAGHNMGSDTMKHDTMKKDSTGM
jgi:hypothetical protein